MSVTLQVIYPATEGTTFDIAYYTDTHLPMVRAQIGAQLTDMVITHGQPGPDGSAPGFHAVATLIFPDQATRSTALGLSADLVADIPNFTNSRAEILLGEVVG